MLLLTCHILRSFPNAAKQIRSLIGWVTVDEYQDVSPLQHELLVLWLGDNRNICVVGDPAQTIYSFAGASSYDLLEFPKEFAPIYADISLNTDYRSTERIVGLANRVLSQSACRRDYLKLKSNIKGGARVSKSIYNTDYDEALSVAQQISKAVKSGDALPTDFAILTRTNVQQNMFCRTLGSLGLHFSVKKDAGLQPDVLDNNIDNTEVSNSNSSVAGDLSFADTDNKFVDNVSEKKHVDLIKKSLLPVTISTIHASKGLEFKHVFWLAVLKVFFLLDLLLVEVKMRMKKNADLCMLQ